LLKISTQRPWLTLPGWQETLLRRVEQMQHLKLFGMAKLYQAVVDQPVHQHINI
jgi:hypothetical protein